jgi:hypothetical protein
MAKKDFSSGIFIFVLLMIGLIQQHWRVVLPIVGVVLALWVISKLVGKQSWSRRKPKNMAPASSSMASTETERSKTVSLDALCIPQGKTFKLAGYTISGGFAYVGKGLESIQRRSIEPSLIDPSLPVETSNRTDPFKAITCRIISLPFADKYRLLRAVLDGPIVIGHSPLDRRRL